MRNSVKAPLKYANREYRSSPTSLRVDAAHPSPSGTAQGQADAARPSPSRGEGNRNRFNYSARRRGGRRKRDGDRYSRESNTAELRWGRMIEKFPAIVIRLAGIAERFATALDCVDTGFLGDGVLDVLPTGVQLGATRVGGVDLNKPRRREAVRAALALAPAPNGFTVAEFTATVHALTGVDHTGYSVRQAAYDLRKLRGKQAHRQAQPIPPLRRLAPGRTDHRRPAHLARAGHRSHPRQRAQPEDGTQTRSLDTRRPRLRTNSHRHANAVHRSRHRNTPTHLRIRREPVTLHHQQIVESRSSSG